jgi:glyoxylase-like metal-dependent hydrolase (beta-lactamase superfamily II)
MADSLIHEILPVGWLQCNCSVVGDPQTREAIVIDPGDEVERILKVIADHRLKVCAIVNTHAHIDHVGGLRKLNQATGAPVLMHREDLELYRALDVQASWIGMPVPEMVSVDELLREGDTVRWGRFAARVLHTPGHTPGSLCLHLPAPDGFVSPDRLFAGDTLFAGSIGRTDLWGGSFPEIMTSLQTKLMALPDATLVFPGHGSATSIGRERESNPFLRSK